MNSATLRNTRGERLEVPDINLGRVIEPAEFRRLLVSHRRMVRIDQQAGRLKGLRDLDTGEIFLTDERRLVESAR